MIVDAVSAFGALPMNLADQPELDAVVFTPNKCLEALPGIAFALARIDRTTATALTLHSSLLTCVFSYHDTEGNPYTTYVNYLIGIKQVALVLTAQTGSSVNGTLTQVYRVASPRMLLRNKTLLL